MVLGQSSMANWANDTYEVMLRPLLSFFDIAELENEVGRLEDFVKPIPELLINIYVNSG